MESRVHVPKKALAAEAVVAEASPFRPARIVILERRRHRDTSRDVVLVVVLVVVILVVILVVLVTIVLVRLADLCLSSTMDGSIEHPRAFIRDSMPTRGNTDGKKRMHSFVCDATLRAGVFDEGGVDDARDE